MALNDKHCTPCEGKVEALSAKAEEELIPNLSGWVIVRENVHLLSKTVETKTYHDAVELLREIATLADEENHHPDLHLYYKKLNIQLFTHKAGGLTENDFILGAKIDELLSRKNFQ